MCVLLYPHPGRGKSIPGFWTKDYKRVPVEGLGNNRPPPPPPLHVIKVSKWGLDGGLL